MIRVKQMFIKALLLCLCISEITSFKLQSVIETIVLDQASVLHNGRTMAEVRAGNNSLDFCKLSVVDERAKGKHIENLEKENFTVTLIDFPTMLAVLDECDKITGDSLVSRLDTEIVDSEVGYWSLIRGIIPGTLWCGVNDIAESYDSLGPNHRVDRCCRAHDHCPDKIKSFSRKQGLLNSTPYTKSNCECDKNFFNCLKNANSSAGNSVGSFYFNFLNLQCIDMRHPERCSLWRPVLSGNTTAEEGKIEDTDRIFPQKENTFVPDSIDTGSNNETDGLLKQQEQKLHFERLPDYYLLPRTECAEWTIDVDQSPKLSFIDNTLEY